MGAKGSKFPHTEEIICPNCPLTPIISIFLNEENGKLTCEFRCPNLHFGYIPFSDLFKNKNIHGQICSMCKKANTELDKNFYIVEYVKNFFVSIVARNMIKISLDIAFRVWLMYAVIAKDMKTML